MTSPQSIVKQFQDHFNARNLDDLRALLAPDMRFNGVSGDGAGRHLLDEWVGRATTTLTPQRWFGEGDVVVVENLVEWRIGDNDLVTDQATWAFAYTVADDLIQSMSRHAILGEAVTKAGLNEQAEIEGVD